VSAGEWNVGMMEKATQGRKYLHKGSFTNDVFEQSAEKDMLEEELAVKLSRQ
jgi:hypothetical protein